MYENEQTGVQALTFVTVYLALGTNLGDRRRNLQTAVSLLQPFVTVTAVSPVYETKPWGVTDQPDFLNLCLAGKTVLPPEALLVQCKAIEQQMGRQKTIRFGPRLIDVDILFYGRLLLNTPRLQIPHPRLQERDFVLVPLAAIAPLFQHPENGLTVAEMRRRLGETAVTYAGYLRP
ncbi:MAG: 2-amino-4-hydroxy-6-hydroxymethyldihydropteridine diphosphokinase [Candidatus Promineifilaceae bacterium]